MHSKEQSDKKKTFFSIEDFRSFQKTSKTNRQKKQKIYIYISLSDSAMHHTWCQVKMLRIDAAEKVPGISCFESCHEKECEDCEE